MKRKNLKQTNVTAKVVMDLLKMMDKDKVVVATNDQQNLPPTGGPVQATDMLKMAVDKQLHQLDDQTHQFHQ